ncbi:MAG TPA: hypothetical protein VGL81_05345 [Polyangiaceae bacterium]
MVAAVSALIIVVIVTAFLPVTLSVFAYAFVEARHRRAWAVLARPAVRLGDGPYRAADVAPSRLQRAPLLVRAAALGCFYWAWFCMLAWVLVGFSASDRLLFGPLAVVGVLVAASVGRAGARLLRRDARAVAFGRRVAVVSAVHATLLVFLGFAVGGADWSAPAAVLGVVSIGQAALLVRALGEHAPLFAPPGDALAGQGPLPAWLARMLARHSRNRAKDAPVLV